LIGSFFDHFPEENGQTTSPPARALVPDIFLKIKKQRLARMVLALRFFSAEGG
jgi:hypothetical protein